MLGGKIKNADFARYVLCVLYRITRAVSVPSDSVRGQKHSVALKVNVTVTYRDKSEKLHFSYLLLVYII